jgi:hypothetical protein
MHKNIFQEREEDNMNLHDEIAKVAYELYEKSGRISGRDMENWIEAEKVVKARAKKGLTTAAVNQMGQMVEAAAQKVKEVGHHKHHH